MEPTVAGSCFRSFASAHRQTVLAFSLVEIASLGQMEAHRRIVSLSPESNTLIVFRMSYSSTDFPKKGRAHILK